MSKPCCVAVVVAVICLMVILLSIETGAQPTVDESTESCSSSTFSLKEVAMVVSRECRSACASNQHSSRNVDTSSLCEYKASLSTSFKHTNKQNDKDGYYSQLMINISLRIV